MDAPCLYVISGKFIGTRDPGCLDFAASCVPGVRVMLAAFRNSELAQEYLKWVHFLTGIPGVNVRGARSVAPLILRGPGTQEVNARVGGLTRGPSTGAKGWGEAAGLPPSPCPAAQKGARAWLGAEAPEMVMSG